MNKIYYLATCDTCKRIMDQLDLPASFEKREIKQQAMTVAEVEALKELAGSYEALFSRRARLYKERGLKDQTLTEEDYKGLILEHYTFLKRPVIVNGSAIFIGNTKKVVEAAQASIQNNS